MATKNIADSLYTELMQKISNGTYSSGDRLPSEQKLSDEYNVSRNTVRSVLGRLNALGILETRHGSGTFVKATEQYDYIDTVTQTAFLASRDLLDIMELRKSIDISAAYSAALNATQEDIDRLEKAYKHLLYYDGRQAQAYAENAKDFHVLVTYASHNEILIKLMELITHISTPQMVDFLYKSGIDPESDFYHSMIFTCIKARHPEEASYMMERHMIRLLDRVRAYVKLTKSLRMEG